MCREAASASRGAPAADWAGLAADWAAPAAFASGSDALCAFPDGPWLEFVRQRGVTLLFVHGSAYPLAVIGQLEMMVELQKVADEDGIVLYRLRPVR